MRLILAGLLLSVFTGPIYAAFSTSKFILFVSERCAVESTFCKEVDFVLVQKNDCSVLRPKGMAVIRNCADGVTPCQHMGYEFRVGSVRWRLNESDYVWASDGKKEFGEEKAELVDSLELSESYRKVGDKCVPNNQK